MSFNGLLTWVICSVGVPEFHKSKFGKTISSLYVEKLRVSTQIEVKSFAGTSRTHDAVLLWVSAVILKAKEGARKVQD